jgi:hypothetical protein
MLTDEIVEVAYEAGRKWLDEHLLDADKTHRELARGQFRAAIEEALCLLTGADARREIERLRPRADEWHMLKVENDMLKQRLKQLEPVQSHPHGGGER